VDRGVGLVGRIVYRTELCGVGERGSWGGILIEDGRGSWVWAAVVLPVMACMSVGIVPPMRTSLWSSGVITGSTVATVSDVIMGGTGGPWVLENTERYRQS
jgi:hypothetical protein